MSKRAKHTCAAARPSSGAAASTTTKDEDDKANREACCATEFALRSMISRAEKEGDKESAFYWNKQYTRFRHPNFKRPAAVQNLQTDTYADLSKAAKNALRRVRLHALFEGTKAQVDDQIRSFFRTQTWQYKSKVFVGEDDEEVQEQMKAAIKALGVPKGRCFFINEELDEEYDSAGNKPAIGDYMNHANGLKESVARLAWLMVEEEDIL